jgi:CheY-like chemotaxis protein
MNQDKHGPKIVLVEDSDELRDLFRDVLQDAGYQVLAYPDADSAFAAISADRPVIVFTDIMLTDGPRGFDLITRIHSELAPPLPKVIACSAFRDFGDEAIQRGAAVFLPKPVLAADLVATIAKLVEGLPTAPAVASALQRSEELRHRAGLTAATWLQALEEKRARLEVHSLPAADWLVCYLGYGEAAVFLLRDQELTLAALAPSTQGPPLEVGPRLKSPGRPIELVLFASRALG